MRRFIAISRYKEKRKAALAARASQLLESEESTTPTSGYISKYLRNRDLLDRLVGCCVRAVDGHKHFLLTCTYTYLHA